MLAQSHLRKVSTLTLTESDKAILAGEDKRNEEVLRQFSVKRTMNEMKIPAEYRGKSFDDYDNAETAEKVKRIVDLGYSLVLSGTPGLGKTHLAVASILHMANRFDNGRPLFLSSPELFGELKDRIRNEVTEKSIIERYLRAPLLVIDDLGVEKKSESSVETFYRIIDGRHREGRQLIITTEFKMGEIGEIYGDRLSSRLCGMGEYIRIEGDDYRVKMQRDRGLSRSPEERTGR